MTVTYSVCISGAGIDYSHVTSVSYAYSTFYITLRFLNQLVRATLAQILGYACPGVSYASAVSLSPIGTLLRWGIRVCSFDYSCVTRVRVLLTFFTTSLRYLRILASLGVTCCDPPTSCLPSRFPHVRSLYWVFRLLSCWSGLQLRWRRSPRRLQRRFFC